jgi:hypothetical protein
VARHEILDVRTPNQNLRSAPTIRNRQNPPKAKGRWASVRLL